MSALIENRAEYEEQKKDLFLELLKKEEVTLILRQLEEGTKGSESFQRMKLKKLLSNKKPKPGKKFSPWDFLMKTIGMRELKGTSPSDAVKILKVKKDEVPTFVRYISLIRHAPELFNENFEKIKENVKNEKDFLYEIYLEQTVQEVQEELLDNFHKTDDKFKEATSKLAFNLVEYADEILELSEKLTDVPIEKYTETELNLIEQGYSLELIPFVYLVARDHNEEMRKVWYYLTVERLAHRLTLDKKRRFLESKDEEENKETKEIKAVDGKKEDSALRKQMKKVTQENKQLEEELKHLSKLYEDELKKALKELTECHEQIKKLSIETEEQKKELKRFEQKMGGYSLNLATDFSELKLVVAHTSPVLYAPIVFPDINFIPAQEVASKVQKKTTEQVMVQKSGLSYMEYRQITQVLKDKGIEWVEMDAVEEREIIMKVSAFIENKGIE